MYEEEEHLLNLFWLYGAVLFNFITIINMNRIE